MRIISSTLTLFIFIWGTLCLNGFREALKYNALGDYTETNIDINTLVWLSVFNTLMIMTNYQDIILLLVFNNIVTCLLACLNMYTYTICQNDCVDFFNDHRFYSYHSFYITLPYIQFAITIIMFYEIIKKYNKNYTIDFTETKRPESESLIT